MAPTKVKFTRSENFWPLALLICIWVLVCILLRFRMSENTHREVRFVAGLCPLSGYVLIKTQPKPQDNVSSLLIRSYWWVSCKVTVPSHWAWRGAKLAWHKIQNGTGKWGWRILQGLRLIIVQDQRCQWMICEGWPCAGIVSWKVVLTSQPGFRGGYTVLFISTEA